MKNKNRRTWKRIVGGILGVIGIGTLVSCYGVVGDEDKFTIYGTVTGTASDGMEYTLSKIVVEISNTRTNFSDITRTNSAGYYEFSKLEEGDYTLRFTDTDHDENYGTFKQKEFGIGLTKDYHYSPKLELEKSK